MIDKGYRKSGISDETDMPCDSGGIRGVSDSSGISDISDIYVTGVICEKPGFREVDTLSERPGDVDLSVGSAAEADLVTGLPGDESSVVRVAESPEIFCFETSEPSGDVVLEGNDDFEWTEERNRAIEEALGRIGDKSVPCVHSQLVKILRLFGTGRVSGESCRALLVEVEGYLKGEIHVRKHKAPVDNYCVTTSRSLVLDSLNIYLEACSMLSECLSSDDTSILPLIEKLADQASLLLSQAKVFLEQARPEDRI